MNKTEICDALVRIAHCAKESPGRNIGASVHLISGPRPFGTLVSVEFDLQEDANGGSMGGLVIRSTPDKKERMYNWKDIFEIIVTPSP